MHIYIRPKFPIILLKPGILVKISYISLYNENIHYSFYNLASFVQQSILEISSCGCIKL